MASWNTADRPLHSGSAEVSAELQDRIQAIKVPPPVQEPADIIFPADNQHRVEDIAIPPALASDQAAKQQPVLAGSKVQLVGAGQATEKREIAKCFAVHQGYQATECKETSAGRSACSELAVHSFFAAQLTFHSTQLQSTSLHLAKHAMLKRYGKPHPSI